MPDPHTHARERGEINTFVECQVFFIKILQLNGARIEALFYFSGSCVLRIVTSVNFFTFDCVADVEMIS